MSLLGLPLLLDKSALQSLSYEKIETLTRHYLLVLPPILLIEIMSDLYSNQGKIVTPGSVLNTHLVQGLANKLITHAAVKNVDYQDLCRAELTGENVSSKFRPCVAPTRITRLQDGSTGAYIDNEVEMKMIRNWQHGNFSADDTRYGAAFRQMNSEVDLNAYKRDLKMFNSPFRSNTLKDLKEQITQTTLSARGQWSFLGWYCDRLRVPPSEKTEIKRQFLVSASNFQEFVPYTFHCYLVEQVFIWGLANDLISSSKKGKTHIDIEYLFYLPHVRVFCSKDNEHRKLWDAFGDEDQQVFIWAEDFATDLDALTSFWRNLSEEESGVLCNFAPYPPTLKNSPTFEAFEKMQKIGALMPRSKFEGNAARGRTRTEQREILERVMQKYLHIRDSDL